MAIPLPGMPRTHSPVQTVHEHQVLLDFGDDRNAELFTDWIQDPEVWQHFSDWAEAQPR